MLCAIGTCYSAHIELRTDSPQYPSLTIPARAFVDDVVSAFPRAVDFGQISFNSIDEQVIGKKVILVQKHQGSGFKVLGATLDVPYMDVAVEPQPAGQRFLVNVTIVKRRAIVRVVSSMASSSEAAASMGCQSDASASPVARWRTIMPKSA